MGDDWPEGWYRDEEPRRADGGALADAPTGDLTGAVRAESWSLGNGAGGVAGGGRGGGVTAVDSWPAQPPVRTMPVRTVPGGEPGPGDGEGWPAPPRSGFGAGGWRRWVRPKRILLVLVALVMAVALVGAGLYFELNSKLTRISALVPTAAASAGTNWLIIGSTGALTRNQENQLHAGHDTDTLSDTIMLLHLPANGGRPVLVSLPRDSYLPIPGHGYDKLNAAYAFGGARLLIQTIQDATGLRVDHYLGIGYTGLVSAVNALGGVRLCLPAAMNDNNAGLHLKAGCQILNGKEALAFTRSRAFSNGDLQRVQDQRVLMKALLGKMTSAGTLINPFASIPAASGAASALTVDSGTQLYQLLPVAFALRNPVTTTVPFGGFETTSVGSVVLWDHQRARQMFNDLATDRVLPAGLIAGSSVMGTAT